MTKDDLTQFISEFDLNDKSGTVDDNNNICVLIVDDDPLIRESLTVVLSDYRLVYAESGEKALELLDDDKGVIIIDVRMPGMDGVQLAKEIQKRSPDSIKILHTAHPADYKTSDILNSEHGLFSFVEKGNKEVLRNEVRRAFEKYTLIQQKKFFEHVTDPQEKKDLINFSLMFDGDEEISRVPEDHSIAGDEEARRYTTGTSYPENSDYILLALEMDYLFGLKDKKILEFCCGPGDLSKIMALHHQPKTVFGVDGSEYMIEFAQKKHQLPNLNYIICNLLKPNGHLNDLKNSDLIICQNSLHHFEGETLIQFFKTGIECLKSGGSFYISDYRRENLEDSYVSQRLLATNKHVRQDLVHTIQASLTVQEIEDILKRFGDEVEYEVFFPDKEFSYLKRLPDYYDIIANDPHAHYLDYKLSLRIRITKH